MDFLSINSIGAYQQQNLNAAHQQNIQNSQLAHYLQPGQGISNALMNGSYPQATAYPKVPTPKRMATRFIERLRSEIEEWHGDILCRAEA